jgi:DNA-binding transcriptional MocR family regulator
MNHEPTLDPHSAIPLYRQLADAIAEQITSGERRPGDRLPATRELALQLGLNRTTVSAAYSQLEETGLIKGHVGRGSFVVGPPAGAEMAGLDWDAILPRADAAPNIPRMEINFAASQPDWEEFPMDSFRRLAKEAIDSPEATEILQLGSPLGYGPLRRYLLAEVRERGVARDTDDLMITNGCQQALDLLARLLTPNGETVVIENPSYHGLMKVFKRTGANIVPVAVGDEGIRPEALEAAIARHKPRAVVLTPSFHNPTGATMPLAARERILDILRRWDVVAIENDIYSELRYEGELLPSLKQLDDRGNVILLRSYSKVSFPGLRVGWVVAPRPVIQRLAELKQVCDLHSDQLSQAVLLRFSHAGELKRHLENSKLANAQRLSAALDACARHLPSGSKFTRPQGGLNLWIELPAALDARDVLLRVQEQGVNFLPGNYFSVDGGHTSCLRLSFGGLPPSRIEDGIRIIGSVAAKQLAALSRHDLEPAPALV